MTWQSVTLEVASSAAEPLSEALMDEGALSVDIQDANAGTEREQPIFGEPGEPVDSLWDSVKVSALFGAGTDISRAIENAVKFSGLETVPPYSAEEIEEQDWVRLTQSQFDPIRISRRLWITPTWHNSPDPDAINLALDPGLAFGTGSHPTTKLCLKWLDKNIRGGEDILDYGCGSGILAIAAMKLGAAKACGIDIDPQAILASRRNALQNDVRADFYAADEAPKIRAQIVVANILANPLKVLAPLLSDAARKGGKIVLSGILEKQAAEVIETYRAWFDMDEPSFEEGWVCLTGTRK